MGVAEFFIIVRREEVMEGLMLVGLLGDLLPLPTIKENKMKVDFEWMRIECISFRYISNKMLHD